MALDIAEIREKPLRNFEGCLQTDSERSEGIILVNANASHLRRHFSIAHELGHFLCGWHKTIRREGFICTRSDMTVPKGDDVHMRQESEANRFAIELLAPEHMVRPYLKRLPELENVVAMANAIEISKMAAARRYIELHQASLAIVFIHEGTVNYVQRSETFPWLPFASGDKLPSIPEVPAGSRFSLMEEVDPELWLGPRGSIGLAAQVLHQQEGHAMVLLEAG